EIGAGEDIWGGGAANLGLNLTRLPHRGIGLKHNRDVIGPTSCGGGHNTQPIAIFCVGPDSFNRIPSLSLLDLVFGYRKLRPCRIFPQDPLPINIFAVARVSQLGVNLSDKRADRASHSYTTGVGGGLGNQRTARGVYNAHGELPAAEVPRPAPTHHARL